MITVSTTDHDDGVAVEVRGHAAEANGQAEKDQVCAAVSAFLIVLMTLNSGVWDGEESGHVLCYVPKDKLMLAEFAVAGMQMMQESYSEHIIVDRQDSRLFQTEETARWNKITLPAPLE